MEKQCQEIIALQIMEQNLKNRLSELKRSDKQDEIFVLTQRLHKVQFDLEVCCVEMSSSK